MAFLEMLRSGEIAMWQLGLLVWTIIILTLLLVVAKIKKRNIWLAALLGIIPFINALSLVVYIAMPEKVRN